MVFKQIATFTNYVSANMTLGLLEENSINCHLRDEYIVTIDPFLGNAVGGIKLMVAEVQFERAVEVIKNAEANYILQTACPDCHAYSLTIEEKTNDPSSLWGKIKNQIAYGQIATYQKIYRCGNCKHIFSELPAAF